MSNLTATEKLNLDKMIKASDVDDNTEKIRELKHSSKIKDDIQELLNLKVKYKRLVESNPTEFDTICENKCSFIFNNYTQLYNKVKKDNIDLNLLAHFIVILKKIEDGKVTQHEGSVMVGKILKEIYIDSALKEGTKNDMKNKKKNKVNKKSELVVKNISYTDFKKMNT